VRHLGVLTQGHPQDKQKTDPNDQKCKGKHGESDGYQRGSQSVIFLKLILLNIVY